MLVSVRAVFVTLQRYIMLIAPEAQMSLKRVVTYASLLTKMHLGSFPDPRSQGPGSFDAGPQGPPQNTRNQKNLLKQN